MVITKICSTCKNDLDLTEFYRNGKWYQSRCKECARASYHLSGGADRAKIHARNLLRKYGITPEQYAEMLFLQGGVCAICGGDNADERKLAVDHNHKTGKVRGLLCNNCNRAIGLLKDNLEVVNNLLSYLQKGDES